MSVGPEQMSFWAGVESRYRAPRGAVALEDLGTSARIPVFNGAFSTLNAVVVVTLLFANGEPVAGWLSVATVIVYASATAFYLITGRGDLFIHFMLWPSLIQNITTHVVLGGFVWSGGFLTWGVVVSATAALFLGRRITSFITGTYVVAAVVLAFLEPTLRSRREQPNPMLSAGLAVDVFVVSLLILVPIVILLVEQISREQARSQSLLLNVLPAVIADRLKRSPGVIADEYSSCTVLFADIVGFTDHASRIPPERLIAELNLVFSRFDALVEQCGAEKIKTMGDGYLAIAGAPEERPDHVAVICELGLRMQAAIPEINRELSSDFRLRVGVNTGRAVAGVVGTARFSYDLWGDTVNLASRMETLSDPGTIRVTEPVVTAVSDRYQFRDGGICEVKGKGLTQTYVLVGAATGGAGDP
jgi:guanylate cyclase